VHVFGSHDGEHWEAVYRFEAARHVHGVYHDPFTDWIWLTTGDTDAESALWATDDHFASVRRIMGGSQQLRAIALLFTQEHVYFGSDTPEERNYLYRMSRATCQVQRLCAVEGSVFHAAQMGNRLYFSTAVEPSTVNDSPWAVLYESLDGQTWQAIARHRKDRWPYKYFQYGQIFLPSGNNATDKLWYSTFSVEPDNWIFSRGICG
jgi:hypothetical protein